MWERDWYSPSCPDQVTLQGRGKSGEVAAAGCSGREVGRETATQGSCQGEGEGISCRMQLWGNDEGMGQLQDAADKVPEKG